MICLTTKISRLKTRRGLTMRQPITNITGNLIPTSTCNKLLCKPRQTKRNGSGMEVTSIFYGKRLKSRSRGGETQGSDLDATLPLQCCHTNDHPNPNIVFLAASHEVLWNKILSSNYASMILFFDIFPLQRYPFPHW